MRYGAENANFAPHLSDLPISGCEVLRAMRRVASVKLGFCGNFVEAL